MRKTDPYRSIAPVYGLISRLVFGKALLSARRIHLHLIKPEHRVLILGGGTGEVLEVILGNNPDQEVTYWESSGKMMSLSRRRNEIYDSATVTWIEEPYPSERSSGNYDVVITNFFLDLFDDQELKTVGERIYKDLNEEGLWIFTDFRSEPGRDNWQSSFIRLMYLFFRITTGLKTQKLADFHGFFESRNLETIQHKEFFNGMIESVAMRK
jgi:ubiquinone/menaquinone biosynthesis C-methylase UbiE